MLEKQEVLSWKSEVKKLLALKALSRGLNSESGQSRVRTKKEEKQTFQKAKNDLQFTQITGLSQWIEVKLCVQINCAM